MKQIIGIIDGTLSRLEPGQETHAGKLFKLALKLPPATRRVWYDRGVQGQGATKWLHVAAGTGLNASIAKLYFKLATHYREGDQIYLFGYSRGAYAVRVLTGMIARLGLLRPEFASLERADHILTRYSQLPHQSQARSEFGKAFHPYTPIAFLGVWETVAALGLNFPFVSQMTPMKITFKDSRVAENVRIARHALAIDENRKTFAPELWTSCASNTDMEQMLFRGDHSVVGGQVEYDQAPRQLGNFSLIWMMEEAQKAGFSLRGNWRDEFPTDPCAPLHDDPLWYDKFWTRAPRVFEPEGEFKIHSSVAFRENCK